ncbi:MAG TPA: 4'-phosphopantetheinyl transferase superfamily protein [Gemmataceae bacterium]|nr:4'-phosphopantetheinyl transferase superfamily protein [Gemmataceae bacterium]
MTATLLDWPTVPAGFKPAPGEVHVWAAALDRPADEVAELSRRLSDEERERAGRFRHAASRDEFIIARALVRRLLGDCLGVCPRSVRFSQTARGKPRLAAEPAPLSFNVSHSHGMALFALTSRCEVGVDVERVRPFSDEMGLADRFFTPTEAAALRALDAAGRLETFFRLWTRKEAYLKAHGLGLSYGLERVEVSHAADDPARIVHIDGDREAAARWSLRTLAPAPGYVGALALRAHDYRLFCWRWHDA